MIDFHSHILPNIDDGSTCVQETQKLIEEAKEAGFKKIISTSHYMENYYESTEEERLQLLKDAEENSVDIELYLGSEIYITYDIVKLLQDKKASTINNSRYVLFELPLQSRAISAKEVVYRLIESGYIPIIAHPERYGYVQDDIKYAKELAEMGALFQANFGSIIGLYGKKAEKTLKKLLNEDLIQFFGSDVHRIGHIYPKMPKIMKKLNKILSPREIKELTETNAQKVLNDEEI